MTDMTCDSPCNLLIVFVGVWNLMSLTFDVRPLEFVVVVTFTFDLLSVHAIGT